MCLNDDGELLHVTYLSNNRIFYDPSQVATVPPDTNCRVGRYLFCQVSTPNPVPMLAMCLAISGESDSSCPYPCLATTWEVRRGSSEVLILIACCLLGKRSTSTSTSYNQLPTRAPPFLSDMSETRLVQHCSVSSSKTTRSIPSYLVKDQALRLETTSKHAGIKFLRNLDSRLRTWLSGFDYVIWKNIVNLANP